MSVEDEIAIFNKSVTNAFSFIKKTQVGVYINISSPDIILNLEMNTDDLDTSPSENLVLRTNAPLLVQLVLIIVCFAILLKFKDRYDLNIFRYFNTRNNVKYTSDKFSKAFDNFKYQRFCIIINLIFNYEDSIAIRYFFASFYNQKENIEVIARNLLKSKKGMVSQYQKVYAEIYHSINEELNNTGLKNKFSSETDDINNYEISDVNDSTSLEEDVIIGISEEDLKSRFDDNEIPYEYYDAEEVSDDKCNFFLFILLEIFSSQEKASF